MAKETPTTVFQAWGTHGVFYAIADDALILRVPLDKAALTAAKPSKEYTATEGKKGNYLIGSSGGFASIPTSPVPGLRVNIVAMVEPSVINAMKAPAKAA